MAAESTTLAPARMGWLEERRSGIGGSESAAVLGVCRWKSPLALWSEKVGLVEPDDLSDNEAVEWGLRLESVVAEAFRDRTGRRIEMNEPFKITRHPDHDWMLATLDAVQWAPGRKGPGNLQIKTAGAFMDREWRDEPPLSYSVQTQHEMAVAGLEWGSIAVLIGGQKLRWFDYERNDRFIKSLIARESAFWDLVQTKTPPEADGSEATARALSALYPAEREAASVALPPAAMQWHEQLERTRAEIKKLEAVEREAKNRLIAAIGDAEIGVLSDGTTYSLKTAHRPEGVVKATSYRVLRCKTHG